MLNERKQAKKYMLYDSMIAFRNASQCVMTKNRLVIACVRRKGRSGGASDPTGKMKSICEATVSGRGPPGSRRSQMQWRLGGD